jgi:uncharacterized protein YcbK (DUF882 family)
MQEKPKRVLDRRRALLGIGAASACLLFEAKPGLAAITSERRLKLFNIHTGEAINVVYASPLGYDEEALRAIDHHLRDFRTGEVHRIEAALLDLVHALSVSMEAQKPFDVISGYRSPQTNAALASASAGVAKKSFHMSGKAIDLSLPGRDIRDLYRAAKSLKRGGVGLYPGPHFVHVDIGPVRSW